MNTEDANNLVAEEDVHSDSETELANQADASDENSYDDTTDLDEDNPEDDGEDIEHDGKKYRIPKELKDAFLMRSDYTRKTQEVAAARQQFEAERQAFTQRQQAHEALAKQSVRVENIEAAIRQYEQVDWDAADHSTDPNMRELSRVEYRKFMELRHALQTAKTELQTNESRLKEQHAQERAQALQETGRTLAREIPGWGQKKVEELVGVAISLGYRQNELEADPDARDWKMLNELHELRQFKAKHTAGQRAAKLETTAPIKQVGTKSPPPPAMSDRSDIKTWMEARNKKVRK